MNAWQIKCKVSEIINDNIELNDMESGISSTARKIKIQNGTLRRAFNGELDSLKVICKILKFYGYTLQIIETDSDKSRNEVYGRLGGIRITCGMCGYSERHMSSRKFIKEGWEMYDKNTPICLYCTGKARQQKLFEKYFKREKENQEV